MGERVDLMLTKDPLGNWDVPVVKGPVLRLVETAGGYPSEEPLRVTLLAAAPGTATVQTSTDLACFHGAGPPCLPPQRLWSVSVVVSAGGPSGASPHRA